MKFLFVIFSFFFFVQIKKQEITNRPVVHCKLSDISTSKTHWILLRILILYYVTSFYRRSGQGSVAYVNWLASEKFVVWPVFKTEGAFLCVLHRYKGAAVRRKVSSTSMRWVVLCWALCVVTIAPEKANAGCADLGRCCRGKSEQCKFANNYPSNTYTRSCYCDEFCQKSGDCCKDYKEYCLDRGGLPDGCHACSNDCTTDLIISLLLL